MNKFSIELTNGISYAKPCINKFSDGFDTIEFVLDNNDSFSQCTFAVVYSICGTTGMSVQDGGSLEKTVDDENNKIVLTWSLGTSISCDSGVVIYQVVAYSSADDGAVSAIWYSPQGRITVGESVDTTEYETLQIGAQPSLVAQFIASVNSVQNDIADVNARCEGNARDILSLETEVADLSDGLSAANADIAAAADKADKNAAGIEANTQSISQLSNKADSIALELQTSTSGILQNISEINSKGKALCAKVTQNTDSIAQNSVSISRNHEKIENVQIQLDTKGDKADVLSNAEKIQSNKNAIVSNQNNILNIESALTQAQSTIATMDERLAQTEVLAQTNKNAVGQNAAAISANSDAISLNKKSIVQNAAKTEQIEAEVASNTAKIEQLESDAASNCASIEQNRADIAQNSQSITDIEGRSIVCSASGDSILLSDSSDLALRGLKIFGSSAQEQQPSLDNPQPIVSVGSTASVNVTSQGKNLFCVSSQKSETIKGCRCVLTEGQSEVLISGTCTSAFSIHLMTATLQPGTYTLSFSGMPGNSVYMYISGSSGTIEGGIYSTRTFTFTEAAEVQFHVVILTGYRFFNNTLKIQLERGSAATSYEAHSLYSNCSFSISTPDGLKGIAVSSGGNHTDSNGKHWVCDEVDLSRGVHIQRCKELIFDGSEAWSVQQLGVNEMFYFPLPDGLNTGYSDPMLCTHAQLLTSGSTTDEAAQYQFNDSSVVVIQPSFYFPAGTFGSLSAWKEYLAAQYEAGTPVTVLYILGQEIETPLGDELLDQYKAMHTSKLCTNIYNSENAYMEVEYAADTKAYIDNKIEKAVAELSAAILTE